MSGVEEMRKRNIRWVEENFGPMHPSTLDTIARLGVHYWTYGKLVDAEEMYERALRGQEKVLEVTDVSTSQNVKTLGMLYKK
jgi:hypothetical protein